MTAAVSPPGGRREAVAEAFGIWLRSPVGTRLVEAEREALRGAARRFHGDALLWVGSAPRLLDITSQCMVRARVFATPQRVGCPMAWNSGASGREPQVVVARPARLPFGAGEVDGVVLHHALEMAVDPRATLREAVRVLRVGGRLVVVGFNPLSPWLFAKLLPAFRRLRAVSAPRLLDWLALLDLALDARPSYLSIPSVWALAKPGARSPRMGAGGRWWRGLPIGGAYLVAARKAAPGLIEAPRGPAAKFGVPVPSATALSRLAA